MDVEILNSPLITGLSDEQKWIPRDLLYDDSGCDLFKKITRTPNYAPFWSEMEIFKNKGSEILDCLKLKENEAFQLIDLGVGDGEKTFTLIDHFIPSKSNFTFIPIDQSPRFLEEVYDKFRKKFPGIQIDPRQEDYLKIFERSSFGDEKKVVMLLGSNLGSLNNADEFAFLHSISAHLNVGDMLVLGLHLNYDEKAALNSYKDRTSYNQSLNRNLLTQINGLLGADFQLEKFVYDPIFNYQKSQVEHYLKSTEEQDVYFEKQQMTIHFSKNERILTFISKKYSYEILNHLIKDTRLQIERQVLDSKKNFTNFILERV